MATVIASYAKWVSKLKKIISTALLLGMLVLPVFGQGRRHRIYRDDYRRRDKCEKFVNCHDARDGRWSRRYYRGCSPNPVRIRVNGRYTTVYFCY